MKRIIFVVSSLLVFSVFNYGIRQKEEIKAHGETVFLKLAPVDPRSLIQGDYMQLRYDIESTPNHQAKKKRGYMVVAIDQKKVGTFRRFYEGEALAPDEKLLHFHQQYSSNIRIVPDSFMFQEGHAKFYERAKYGVFRFDNKGSHILVGLADDKLKIIQPDETRNIKPENSRK